MRRIITAATLAVIAVLALASVALGQDTGPVDEPTVGLLASAAGLATVIFIIVNLLRGVITPPEAFDKWAPLVAVVIGILLAEAYAIFVDTGNTNTIESRVIQAALVGLFAGGFSQNVNTVVTRAMKPVV
jgi:hypothetical protein